jgi:type 1 fimbria pilin
MLRLIIIALGLFAAQNSYAVICLKNGNLDIEAPTIPIIALAPTLPKNTVFWRSEPQTINIECWHEGRGSAEYVTMYFSPNDPSGTMLGSEVEAGVRLGSKDYRWADFSGGLTFYGSIIPACNVSTGCRSSAVKVPLTFSVFLSKRSAAGPGKEGPVISVNGDGYVVFQIAGMSPPPPPPIVGVSYAYGIVGLRGLRYVGCASVVDVAPRSIDFGSISSFSAETNRVMRQVSFSITSTKSCDSVYGLTGRFLPLRATVSADKTILIPSNNSSVGIRLLRKENSSAVPIGTDFELVPNTANRVTVKDYIAELRWMSNKAKIGSFDAAVQLEVFYK